MPITPPVIDIDPDPSSGFDLLFTVARQQEKTVPEEVLRRLPVETMPVSSFIAADLPRSLQDVLRSAESCLSKETLNWTVEHLWKAHVPPRAWLNDLDIALNREWLGICSIEAPVGSKGLRFPLWVGNFWFEMIEVVEQREKWDNAQGWLRKMVRSPEVREAEKLLDRTPWGLRLWSLPGHEGSTRVGLLATILSNEWLAERHIDTLVAYIGDRLRGSNVDQPDTTLVADQYLASLLSRRRDETATKLREDQELRTYAGKISDGRHERLLLPGHIGGTVTGHWIVFSVDIKKKTISYGDSLMPSSMRDDANHIYLGLSNWLKAVFGTPFRDKGRTFAIGKQEDGHSCGICVINSIEHELFGTTLFTHSSRNILRIHYFTEAMKFLLEETPHQSSPTDVEIAVEPVHIGQGIGVEDGMDVECVMVGGGAEETTDGWWKGGEVGDTDAGLVYDSTDDAPLSPDSSIFISDVPNPPLSETDLRATDNDSSPNDVENIKPVGPVSKWKVPAVGKSVRSPPRVPVKRRRVCEAGEGSSDEGSGREVTGPGRSATGTRKLRKLMKSGELVVDEQKKAAYERKCVEMDPKARFRYQRRWEVLHSKCGKWFAMSEPYNTTKFKLHVGDCRSKGQSGLIDDFFKRQDTSETGIVARVAKPGGRKHIVVGGRRSKTSIKNDASLTPLSVPEPKLQGCRGIGKVHNDRIPIYISRALIDGAGSRSESAITTMLFGNGVKYSNLDEKSRNEVLVVQVKLRSWTICRELRVVYSTKCRNFVNPGGPATCDECLALLKLDTFKKSLRMEPAPLEMAKFTPRRQYNGMRDLGISYAKIKGLVGLLDDKSEKSVWVRFASGVLEGKYENHKLLLGLVHAAVLKSDREERHVGLQNFSYTSFLLQASHVASVLSPEVYRFLQTQLQLPSIRHHQMVRSREPSFPVCISERCFINAQTYVTSLCYTGPVVLACDDTKLHPSLQVYWDASISSHILVGTTVHEEIIVANPKALEELLEKHKSDMATKLRLWCILIPLIGIRSMIVAAEAIPDNFPVKILYPKSRDVIEGLKSHGVNIVSYACDGTQVERSLQDKLVSNAKSTIRIKIPDADPEEGDDYVINIPMFGPGPGSPVVMIQDSKHALKTFRNNLFSGARALVLGNHVSMYSQVRRIAFGDPPGPIYRRDVEKMDRQDDNAATRLFTAETLDYIAKHHPACLGLVVYLFIMGEVVDAYQGRTLSHLERIKMVLRCRYFLRLWKRFLWAAGYTEKYCISREAQDIIEKLVDGLLALIYVYRDHLQGEYPLLLWLHSTKLCKHIFAECRKLIKDFSHLNFLFMTVRLHVLVHAAATFSRGTDPKARAMGYSHSYLDPETAEIKSLAVFPTDVEIEAVAAEAWEEAVALLDLLGIQNIDITQHPPAASTKANHSGPACDTSDADEVPDEEDNQVETKVEVLRYLIDIQQSPDWEEVDEETRNRIHTLTCAATALDIEDQEGLVRSNHSLETTCEDVWKEEARAIEMLTKRMKRENSAAAETPAPFKPGSVDLSQLVQIRRVHQTRRATKSIRPSTEGCGGPEEPTAGSQRRQICMQMADVIRRTGTGLERGLRWKSGGAPGTKDHTTMSLLNGNSANAELAAGGRVKASMALRNKHFMAVNLSRYLNDGLVGDEPVGTGSRVRRLPLTAGAWAFVFSGSNVYVGKVLAFYSKEAGAGSRHAWQESTTSIGAISYLVVHAFEIAGPSRNLFRLVHFAQAHTRAETFIHIPSTQFLCRIQNEPNLDNSGNVILSDNDWTVFSGLAGNPDRRKMLEAAINALNTASRRGKGVGVS